jgi:hypothetical protein
MPVTDGSPRHAVAPHGVSGSAHRPVRARADSHADAQLCSELSSESDSELCSESDSGLCSESDSELGSESDQSKLSRTDGGVGAVADVELGENVGHVILDGTFRQRQPIGDFLVRRAGRDEREDFALAW